MGVYLSKPCIDVHIQEGTYQDMVYTAGDMQGWRKNMEDDHIIEPNVIIPGSKDIASVYAVFDGHGGKEVAVFCQYYFVEEMVKLDTFRTGQYDKALAETFLKIDTLLEGKLMFTCMNFIFEQICCVNVYMLLTPSFHNVFICLFFCS